MPENPEPSELINIFKKELIHQPFINQKNRISCRIWFVYFNIFIFDFVLGYVLPVYLIRIILSAIVTGAFLYDLLHYYYHFGGNPPFRFLREMKAQHLRHHYENVNTNTRYFSSRFGYDLWGDKNKIKKIKN